MLRRYLRLHKLQTLKQQTPKDNGDGTGGNGSGRGGAEGGGSGPEARLDRTIKSFIKRHGTDFGNIDLDAEERKGRLDAGYKRLLGNAIDKIAKKPVAYGMLNQVR